MSLISRPKLFLMLSHFYQNKVNQDLIWNYASLAIFAVSGIFINLIVAKFYGSEVLGVFNQVYAIYMISSQLAVGGIHFSVLKHIAELGNNDHHDIPVIVTFGLLTVAITGSCIFLGSFWATSLWSGGVVSINVGIGLKYALPAIIPFCLNKVLLMSHNGLRHMKWFAFGNSLRYFLMLVFVFFPVVFHWEARVLYVLFFFAETILLVVLVASLYAKISLKHNSAVSRVWIKKHLSFGIRGFLGGFLLAINARVDILLVGHFLDDKSAGLYSFGALIFEGLDQVLFVVQNNVNPILARLLALGDIRELKRLFWTTQKIVYPVMIFLALCIILLFPVFVSLFFKGQDFESSWAVVAILVCGLCLISGFRPFDAILNQAGFPGSQTIMNAMTIISNIFLNVILIPILGIKGAAMGTVCSMILTVFYLLFAVRRRLGFCFSRKLETTS